jgi:hypothetical protein
MEIVSHRCVSTQFWVAVGTRREVGGRTSEIIPSQGRFGAPALLYSKREAAEIGVKDSDVEETIKTAGGATLTRHADGSVTAKNKSARVEFDPDGPSKVHMEKITRVSLDNLVDVQSHSIKNDQTATSHHIIFRGGGELRFSYRPNGRLLEFRALGLTTNITKDGVITIGKSKKA